MQIYVIYSLLFFAFIFNVLFVFLIILKLIFDMIGKKEQERRGLSRLANKSK